MYMATPDYLKCPGSDPNSKAHPELYPCAACGTEIEIWTDERGGKCPSCNAYFKRGELANRSVALASTAKGERENLALLVKKASHLGATGVTVISAKCIVVDEKLAGKCKEPRCENFGLSGSCPPFVSGPSAFRKALEKFQQAMFFKLDVPSETLFTEERREVFQLLHQIAAGIQKAAIDMGYANSRAYAGGSCKQIFCHDHPECLVVSGKGRCRNPLHARPSMSGFGIDVSKLFDSAGWTMNWVTHDTKATATPMTCVCGLVLVG